MKFCPHCQSEIADIPKRSGKCPNCSNPIFVRSGRLLIEEDYRATTKWHPFLAQYGITGENIFEKRDEISKQFGEYASVRDTIWGLFNALLMNRSNLVDLELIYSNMCHFVTEYGKDPAPYIAEAHKIKRQLFIRKIREYLDNILIMEVVIRIPTTTLMSVNPVPHSIEKYLA